MSELTDLLESSDFSGVVLATRGDEVLVSEARGFAERGHRVPNTMDTMFGLASFTKMFTAVSVIDLGIDLHRPVVELLPSERRPRTLRADVTTHHLLSHTSGIADYAEEEDEDFDYAAIWAARPTCSMTSPIDFLPLFGDLEPYRPPGGRVQYCNAGFLLLGLIVEEVAQQPFADVVRERVFAKAGMRRSDFLRMDEVHEGVATGYERPEEPGRPWRSNIFSVPVVGGPDGGSLSTAGDLDRFLTAYGDGTLLSPADLELVLTRRGELDPGIGMGYGVLLWDGPPSRWGHGGGDPGVGVLASRIPERGINAIVISNAPGSTGPVRDALLAEVL